MDLWKGIVKATSNTAHVVSGGLIASSTEDHKEKVEQLKEIEKFDYVIQPKTDEIINLGEKANMVPTNKPKHIQKLYVTEKLFSNAFHRITNSKNEYKDTIKLVRTDVIESATATTTAAAASSGDNHNSAQNPSQKLKKIKLIAKTGNEKGRVIITNASGDVMSVIVQHVHLTKQSYKIYSAEPVYPNQRPASEKITFEGGTEQRHRGQLLYSYGLMDLSDKTSYHLKSGKELFTMDVMTTSGSYENSTYTMEKFHLKGGLFETKPYIIYKHGKPAAVLRQGDFVDDIKSPSWNITVCPGIDPIVLVTFVAVVDTQEI